MGQRKISRTVLLLSVLGVAAASALLIVGRCNSSPSAKIPDEPVPQGTKFRRIDTHSHLMVGSLGQVLKLMDRYGFEHIVDFSGGTPQTNLELHLAQARASGGRISVFMTLSGKDLLVPGYGDRIAASIPVAKEMGAIGFKIAKGLGLGFLDPSGRLLPVDDSSLDPIFDACGMLGMPVAIHAADPKAFWLPPDPSNERYEELKVHPGWSFHGEPVPSWEELLNQLERRIARHPSTTFISVHFGNAAEEPERVARMLRTYPNLYIDTAARIPEFGRHSPKTMHDFFMEFQDRILYASDLGVGRRELDLMLGSEGENPPTMADVDRFFNSSYRYFETSDKDFETPTPIQGKWTISGIALPRSVLEKIYAKNAERVLGLGSVPAKN